MSAAIPALQSVAQTQTNYTQRVNCTGSKEVVDIEGLTIYKYLKRRPLFFLCST